MKGANVLLIGAILFKDMAVGDLLHEGPWWATQGLGGAVVGGRLWWVRDRQITLCTESLDIEFT